MIVVFFSSVLNHHQIAFCDNMFNAIGDNFIFVSTMKMEKQRIDLKYPQFNRPYELKSYLSEENQKKAKHLFINADVVIFSGKYDTELAQRMKEDKLTFLYRERLFKQKYITPFLFIKFFLKQAKLFGKYKNNKLFLMCASAYSYDDHRKLGLFKNKAFVWGYFPVTIKYENIETLVKEKRKNSLLWVGRFIKWKHPEAALYVAKRLKQDGYKFKFTMIGCGELEKSIKDEVRVLGLQDSFCFLGSLSPDRVRTIMEKSEIFLFTSDCREGWGAVLNEAMNSACAVVADASIGAVPFLLIDNKTGLKYKANFEKLYRKVKFLFDSREEIKQIGINAYHNLINYWSAEVATKRFLDVSKSLIENKSIPVYEKGPMKLYYEKHQS